MHQRGFRSVFVKLFASVMLALTLFAIAMVLLTQLVHDKDATIRSQVLATQILGQVDPFLVDLNKAALNNNRLQARFMLAVVKKSFDIFDESLKAKMGLYDHEGRLLMQTESSDLPTILPKKPSMASRVFPFLSDAPAQQVQVYSSTGYTLLFESRIPPKKAPFSAALNLFTGTILLLLIMAGVLWWIARSMTWRIDQLSQQMVQLGDGDFSARVNVKGNDEIASLAKGFNQAAQKIEHLVNANNLLLAHASHELRTPITRIRLQIEMMDMLASELKTESKTKFDKRAAAINRDLIGLNDLVESILLVSRLDAGHALQQVERLDLYDLVYQEHQHYPEAFLMGEHIVIEGQSQLLTHLIRNLLNNAMLHGVPPVTVILYGVENYEDAGTIPEHLVQAVLAQDLDPMADDELVNTIAATPFLTDISVDISANSNNAVSKSVDETGVVADSHIIDSNTVNSTADDATLAENKAATANAASDNNANTSNATTHNGPVHDHSYADIISSFSAVTANATAKQTGEDTDPATAAESQTETGKDLVPVAEAKTRRESLFSKHLRKAKEETPIAKPNFAVLAVIDEGSGIPADKREDIFSPFVRLQQNKKGSGLGLSLVSQIVTAHQGRISTDTVNGHTRFLVVLPVETSNHTLVQEAS
jgi:signal transduction histidine kinase